MLLLWVIPGPNDWLWSAADMMLYSFDIHGLLVAKGQELYREGSLPVAAAVIALASAVYFIKRKSDWHAKGEDLLKAEKYDECLTLMKETLSKGEDARAYKLIALCNAALATKDAVKNTPQAESYKNSAHGAIENCIRLDSGSFENWLAKGFVCEAIGHTDEAITAYEKTLFLNRNCDYAFGKQCELLCAQDSYNNALAACDKRLNEMPDDGDALFYKGVALASLQKFQEALECFEKCIRMGVHKEPSEKNKAIIQANLQKHA